MVAVIGYLETGRLLARSWRSRFQTHCYFGGGFYTGLATLVLGVRKHLGACRLRNSCLCRFLSWISGRRDGASRIRPGPVYYFR